MTRAAAPRAVARAGALAAAHAQCARGSGCRSGASDMHGCIACSDECYGPGGGLQCMQMQRECSARQHAEHTRMARQSIWCGTLATNGARPACLNGRSPRFHTRTFAMTSVDTHQTNGHSENMRDTPA